MNIIKSGVRNRLSIKALNIVLRIRKSGITIDNFHKDYVHKCVNFWYNMKKRRPTKTKENSTNKGSPLKLQKGPKFDIYELSDSTTSDKLRL